MAHVTTGEPSEILRVSRSCLLVKNGRGGVSWHIRKSGLVRVWLKARRSVGKHIIWLILLQRKVETRIYAGRKARAHRGNDLLVFSGPLGKSSIGMHVLNCRILMRHELIRSKLHSGIQLLTPGGGG